MEDFEIATFWRANRRIRLVGSAGAGQILFTDAIDDFARLLAAVRDATPHAERRSRPPWWKRFLLTG
jgi:hypothetical protein